MPIYEYDCSQHGVFELILDHAAPFMDCPNVRCGKPSGRIPSRFGFRGFEEHAIQLGGKTFRRDDIESALDHKDSTPAFYEKPEFKERVMESLSRNAYKEMHGTLAPQSAEGIDGDAKRSLETVSVDPQAVEASNNVLTETMRKTEFKE